MLNRDKDSTGSSENRSETYVAYLAGGLFTQHDLVTNVWMKEAVWRLSNGRFELFLPQSKEFRRLDRKDLAANIRNTDLHRLVQADILIARFDGTELDTGAVVEFMVAKMLGKPSVVIRSDTRHLTSDGLDDPYNLMVKNWPRTVEVYVESLIDYLQMIEEARKTLRDIESEMLLLEAELAASQRGIDDMAVRLIEALNSVLEMESPYPPELREAVYEAFRYTPGAGFNQLLTEHHLRETLQKLMEHNTL